MKAQYEVNDYDEQKTFHKNPLLLTQDSNRSQISIKEIVDSAISEIKVRENNHLAVHTFNDDTEPSIVDNNNEFTFKQRVENVQNQGL